MKWGTLYPAHYVNRLYHSLRKHVNCPFTFHCITDDATDLDSRISVLDLNQFHALDGIDSKWRFYTYQKLYTFDKSFLPGTRKVLLDVDVLIQNDLTEYLSQPFEKPTIIYNYWYEHDRLIRNFSNITTPFNSSFVVFEDDQLDMTYQYARKWFDKLSFSFGSLDKFLYYRFRDSFNFHPRKTVYAYNFGAEHPHDMEEEKFRPEYSVCIFNTSHGNGKDLRDTTDWAKQMWESYD